MGDLLPRAGHARLPGVLFSFSYCSLFPIDSERLALPKKKLALQKRLTSTLEQAEFLVKEGNPKEAPLLEALEDL